MLRPMFGAMLALLLLACLVLPARLYASATLAVSYAGVNYYDPPASFDGCSDWTWATSCYNKSGVAQQVGPAISSDAAFVTKSHLGSFVRVWISLDQLMTWNSSTGYAGWNGGSLSHVDDALSRFHAQGIKVDLVLYSYAKGNGAVHQFHPEALDGNHATMRANYLQAVRDFVAHLGGNSTDSATVAVIDLQNEAYYQLEQYYGYSDDAMIHQWLVDLYGAAHGAASGFAYTISDTGRLLTTDASTQGYWESMYPVDVYDIHLYSDTPSSSASRWATGLNLPKPWFAGEAGCGSGNINCTYNGANAASVDQYWLSTMKGDGASAVLIEDRSTVWTYPNGPNSQTLTATGKEIVSTATPSSTPTPTITPIPTATSSCLP